MLFGTDVYGTTAYGTITTDTSVDPKNTRQTMNEQPGISFQVITASQGI